MSYIIFYFGQRQMEDMLLYDNEKKDIERLKFCNYFATFANALTLDPSSTRLTSQQLQKITDHIIHSIWFLLSYVLYDNKKHVECVKFLQLLHSNCVAALGSAGAPPKKYGHITHSICFLLSYKNI